MAKMTNYGRLLPIVIFVIGLSSAFSGVANADDQEGQYSHSHITASWDHGLICGDHKCAPGELHKDPTPVVPVRGIR